MERVKLTSAFIKSVVADVRRGGGVYKAGCKFWDTEVPGLLVRCGSHSVSWYLIKRVGDKVKTVNIGSFPGLLPAEARGKALERLGALANYGDINMPVSRAAPLVKDAIDFYLDETGRRDAKSLFKQYVSIFERRIDSVHRSEIQAIHDLYKDVPVAADLAVVYLRSAINRLFKRLELNLSNPASDIKMFKARRIRKRFLNDEEAPRLMEALTALSASAVNADAADALLLMIYTGVRKFGVLSMRWDEIDGAVWVIPANKPGCKTKRDIVVPLNSFALEILERRRAVLRALSSDKGEKPGEFVFPGRTNKTKHLQDVKGCFKRACAVAGVVDCHIHDLRRTLGSWMLMNGTPIEVVSKTLGHTSIKVTEQVYAHLLPSKISEATEGAIIAMRGGKSIKG